MITVANVLSCIDRRTPFVWAKDDGSGLNVGNPGAPASRILIALDPSPAVVGEAARRDCQLLITHHPSIYRPIADLREDRAVPALVAAMIRANVAHIATHYPLDCHPLGVSQALAERIGLTTEKPLQVTGGAGNFKLVVFVPTDKLDEYRIKLLDTGIGVIEAYHHCSFASIGEGTFWGTAASHPAYGRSERLERVHEGRLEMSVPKEMLAQAISDAIRLHPYEEVAYDVIPLENRNRQIGFGRVGQLPQEMRLLDLAKQVKDGLKVDGLQVFGDREAMIKRVAVLGGGGILLPEFLRSDCDCLVTGEMSYHAWLDLQHAGKSLILAGHYATERPGVDVLADWLRIDLPETEILVSEIEHDPFWRSIGEGI